MNERITGYISGLTDEGLEYLSDFAFSLHEMTELEIGRRINNRTWTRGEIGRRIAGGDGG